MYLELFKARDSWFELSLEELGSYVQRVAPRSARRKGSRLGREVRRSDARVGLLDGADRFVGGELERRDEGDDGCLPRHTVAEHGARGVDPSDFVHGFTIGRKRLAS